MSFRIQGNEKAHKNATSGRYLDERIAFNDILTPLVVLANKIYDQEISKITTIQYCAISAFTDMLKTETDSDSVSQVALKSNTSVP